MKQIILSIAILLFSCTEAIKRKAINTTIDSSMFTEYDKKNNIGHILDNEKDSIVIYQYSYDVFSFNKKQLTEILRHFPVLYDSIPLQPNLSYERSGIWKKFQDSTGNEKTISFGSEVGQDEYYLLYAYLLRKQTGIQFQTRRNNLIKIFENINHIFGSINYGGTYYGHQGKRLIADAEYAIFWYAKNEGSQIKPYDISLQKQLYIKQLKQIITDAVAVDQNTFTIKDKENRKSELFKTVSEIDRLVTDYFYLRQAEKFQFSHY